MTMRAGIGIRIGGGTQPNIKANSNSIHGARGKKPAQQQGHSTQTELIWID